jgi:hypothetical protein
MPSLFCKYPGERERLAPRNNPQREGLAPRNKPLREGLAPCCPTQPKAPR